MRLPPVPESLRRIAPMLEEFSAPSVAFALEPERAVGIGDSKFGGAPDLPKDFEIQSGPASIDFLLQIDLAKVSQLDKTESLPKMGLLSFFYDLKEQPWGYDPKCLSGFRVFYIPAGVPVVRTAVSRPECALGERRITFRDGLTLPHIGSRAYEQFDKFADLNDGEAEAYFAFAREVECSGGQTDGNHHLLGHADNVQGDMQL